MKTIVLIPTKNEDWILRNTLENISGNVDMVIIADQNSTDRTPEICKAFKNVEVIRNPYTGHSNQVRWLLLEEARKYGKNNLIICIDADEIISPKAIQEIRKLIDKKEARPGDIFKFKWIQLWQSVYKYRNDGVWKNNFKNAAFIDNEGVNEYERIFIINDHTSRVPDSAPGKEFSISHPLLHFHFVAWKRNQVKQAWYRCCELINGKRNAKRINNTYRVTMNPKKLKILDVPESWYNDIKPPMNLENISSNWHFDEIKSFFNQYKITFFEDLQIWHIPELEGIFIREVGRKPQSKTYPYWLVFLNEIKNKIVNFKIRNKIPLQIRIKIGPILAFITYFINTNILIKRRRPLVLNPEETIDLIIKNSLSVIRFGDGEMSIIQGENLGFQKYDIYLKNKMENILSSHNQKLLICIPGIWEKINHFSKKSFWFTLHHLFKHGSGWKKFINFKIIYGDAFITRPYLNFKNRKLSETIFKGMISIWNNKNVVLIEGFGSRLGVGNDLFNNTKSLKRILCPSENAFEKYEEIKKEALKIDRNSMVLLSLGPTAKVLAYDLFLLGYRVIDIGHIDMEYEMYLRNSQEIVKVNYKYFNEINERSPEDCKDEKYTNQIIAKIV